MPRTPVRVAVMSLAGSFCRLLPLVLVLVAATAPPASAGPRHKCGKIAAIHVSPEGSGSRISVELRGHRHRVSVLVVDDRISAYAVADVDNNGHLDILAASEHHGLLLWRNAGRGRFVLATRTQGRVQHPGTGPGVRATGLAEDAIQFSDNRYTAVLPRAPASAAWVFFSQYPLLLPPSIGAFNHPRPLGRAPPMPA
jgi:hypothetical protein